MRVSRQTFYPAFAVFVLMSCLTVWVSKTWAARQAAQQTLIEQLSIANSNLQLQNGVLQSESDATFYLKLQLEAASAHAQSASQNFANCLRANVEMQKEYGIYADK